MSKLPIHEEVLQRCEQITYRNLLRTSRAKPQHSHGSYRAPATHGRSRQQDGAELRGKTAERGKDGTRDPADAEGIQHKAGGISQLIKATRPAEGQAGAVAASAAPCGARGLQRPATASGILRRPAAASGSYGVPAESDVESADEDGP